MNRLIVFTGIAIFFVNLALAKDLLTYQVSYQKHLEAIDLSHTAQMSNLAQNYSKALNRLRSKVQKAGDLDKTIGVDKEITRFKLSQTMPKKPSTLGGIQNLQILFTKKASKYLAEKSNKVISSTSNYEKSLEILQKNLISYNMLDKAQKVQKERKSVMISGAYTTAVLDRKNNVVPDKPRNPDKQMEATLYISCDDSFQVWLNGKEIGKGAWTIRKGRKRYSGILYNFALKISENDVLAILARDHQHGKKSAGLYACIVLNDSARSWSTDKSWSCSIKRQDSRINSEDDKLWLTSINTLVASQKVSEDNIYPTHPNRIPDYRKKSHKNLCGKFIWSTQPSRTIYIKEKIKLRNFK